MIAATLCFAATPAMAYFAGTGYTSDSYGSTTGGEFIFHPSGNWSAHRLEAAIPNFETFCIEHTEYLGFGVQFNVDIDPQALGAIHGGPGGNGYNDPLDPRTAWLYCEFVKGTLPTYHYSTATPADVALRIASADALQNAIWALEGEENATPAGQAFIDLAFGHSSSCTRVMNLWRAQGDQWGGYGAWNGTLGRWEYQSLLVCVVPAPAAGLLGVIGLGLIGWVKRRLT